MNVGSIGLVLASATSLSNVVLDVSRKKALVGRNLLRTTFLLRAATAFFITIVLLVRWGVGYAPHFWPDHVPPNVLSFMPPVGIYFFYLILDSSLIAINVVLYNRAVQVSPLSLTIPFLAFTPVFLLGTGYVILGEIPTLLKCEGILFVVLGSLLMHRRSFLKGFFEPFREIPFGGSAGLHKVGDLDVDVVKEPGGEVAGGDHVGVEGGFVGRGRGG